MSEENVVARFADVLRQFRESQSLTRDELARQVEVDASYIHRLEKGNRRPSRKTVISMAEALKLDAITTNEWLSKAGHGLLPISQEADAKVQRRRVGRWLNSASWGQSLEAIGLKQSMLKRLVDGVGSASLKEKRRVATALGESIRFLTESIEVPVQKALIPVAGGAHRFLSYDVMHSLLLRTITEAAECGIHEIILVLAPEMERNFFVPLTESLNVTGFSFVNLKSVIQEQPIGLGHAILISERAVEEQPFAVLLPDDVLNTKENRSARKFPLKLMLNVFATIPKTNLLAVTPVSKKNVSKCGIVRLEDGPITSGTQPVLTLVEKPSHVDSDIRDFLCIVGRYVLQPEIFNALRNVKNANRRLELTTALQYLRDSKREIRALPLKATRKDLGRVLGEATKVIES